MELGVIFVLVFMAVLIMVVIAKTAIVVDHAVLYDLNERGAFVTGSGQQDVF